MPTLAEKHAKYQEGVADFWEKVKSIGVGVLKGATTDLAGAPVDIMNEVIGAVSGGKLKSAEPVGGSKFLRRTLAGDSQVEDKNLFETAGTPETAVKAMIVGAAKIPDRLRAFENYTAADKTKSIRDIRADRFAETGVYLDKDGALKTAISDADATINLETLGKATYLTRKQEDFVKLGEVLNHPELFKLYPELKDVDVHWTMDLVGSGYFNDKVSTMGLGGSRSHAQRTAELGVPGPKDFDISRYSQGTLDTLRNVILHEVQHGIQSGEGFTKGGNPQQFLPPGRDLNKLKSKLAEKEKTATPDQKEAIERFRQKINAQSQEAMNRYRNLPGEQEARFTELTSNMTEEQLGAKVLELLRKGETPQNTFTVPIRPIP
jgi:hypothetical protein